MASVDKQSQEAHGATQLACISQWLVSPDCGPGSPLLRTPDGRCVSGGTGHCPQSRVTQTHVLLWLCGSCWGRSSSEQDTAGPAGSPPPGPFPSWLPAPHSDVSQQKMQLIKSAALRGGSPLRGYRCRPGKGLRATLAGSQPRGHSGSLVLSAGPAPTEACLPHVVPTWPPSLGIAGAELTIWV